MKGLDYLSFPGRNLVFPHFLSHSRCAPAENTNTIPAHGVMGFCSMLGLSLKGHPARIPTGAGGFIPTHISQAAGTPLDPKPGSFNPASQHLLCRNRFLVDEDGIGMAGGLLDSGRGPVPTPPGPWEPLQSLWLLSLGKAAQSLLQQCLEAPLGCPVWITVRRQPCLSFP